MSRTPTVSLGKPTLQQKYTALQAEHITLWHPPQINMDHCLIALKSWFVFKELTVSGIQSEVVVE